MVAGAQDTDWMLDTNPEMNGIKALVVFPNAEKAP